MSEERETGRQPVDSEVRLLPKPRRWRERFLVPVPLYGDAAQLLLPCDMTEAESQKLARVILAYGKLTPFNAKRP